MTPSLGALAALVLRQRRLVVGLAVLVGLVSAALASSLRLDPSIVALLPPDNPQAQALRRIAAETGGINTITLTFDGGGDARAAVLDDLAERLTALDTVAYALHRVDPDTRAHLALLRLEPADADALAAGLERGDVAIVGPIANQLRAWTEQHLLVPDDGRGRIVVKPTESNIDPDFCSRVVRDVHAAIAEADLAAHGVRHVYSAGPYVYIADGAEGIRDDLVRTSGVTVALVLLVLVVGFRSWRAPLLLFPPLLLATLANLAFLRVVFGVLDTFTSFGIALLVGLGLDFGVHLVGRVREERARGAAVEAAVVRAWEATGPPCVFAALTSAAGFAALAIGQFQGLRNLGLALSVGLLLCLVSMLVLLPLLIVAIDREDRVLLGAGAPDRASWPGWTARPAFALALVATGLAAAFGLPRLAFEYDITRMNRDKMAYSDMAEDVQALVRQAYPPVVIPTAGLEETRSEHRRLAGLVAQGALPHVRAVLSVETLLPSDQAARLPALRRIRAALDAPAVDALPAPVRADLDVLRPWTARARSLDDLPPGLVELVGGRTRVLLLPTGELFDMRQSAALIDEIDAVTEGAGSEQLAQGAVFRAMGTDMPRILVLAFGLVTLLTALDLRRPLWVLATVACLLAGLVWAGATIAVAGQRVTLMNLVGFPILLGIGVDVVIHLAHRLRAEGSAVRALRTVGIASLLSTLTTIASFASLTVAGSGGIRSLGRLVVLGLAAVTVASGALLLLGWAALGRQEAPAPVSP